MDEAIKKLLRNYIDTLFTMISLATEIDKPDKVKYAESQIAECRQAIALLEKPCEWRYDEIHDMYDTQCGQAYCLIEGGRNLKANGIKGCPFCIRPIEEVK